MLDPPPPDRIQTTHRDNMAAAAGKRTCKAIRRFHDEFASLGSNPTPDHAAEMLGIAQYGEHREENNVMNALLLGRELADFAFYFTMEGLKTKFVLIKRL